MISRRRLIQIFAAVPAVVMAQRAIPAVLGSVDVIPKGMEGWVLELRYLGEYVAHKPLQFKMPAAFMGCSSFSAVFAYGELDGWVDEWRLYRDGKQMLCSPLENGPMCVTKFCTARVDGQVWLT